MKHLPNAITIGRIVVTPILLFLLWSNTLFGIMTAFWLFVLAAISDYADGKIARSLEVNSRLGQFLDPVADKVLVLGTFVILALILPEIVPWWGVLLIAIRDGAVTTLRSWAEAHGRSIRTLQVARLKTAVQLTFLITLLFVLVLSKIPGTVGHIGDWILESPIPYICMMVVVVITVATGVIYFIRQESAPPIKPNG